MKPRLWLAAMTLTAAAGLAGCDDLGLSCTQIGWYEGATLHIALPHAENAAPIPGRYHLEVEAEGETVALDIDWSPSSWSCGDHTACAAQGQRITLQQFLVGDLTVDVAVGHVDGKAGPALIRVRLGDGTTTRSAEVKPQYRTTEPNGDGCGEAHTAEVDVTPS